METKYEMGIIEDFEIKILASGRCNSFLPLSFVGIQGKLSVTEHEEGWRQLSIEQLKNPYELLAVIENLVISMKEAQNCLITPERYRLTKDGLYGDEGGSQMRLRFIPGTDMDGKQGLSEKVKLFLGQWQMESQRCQEYTDRVIQKLMERTLSPESLLRYVGELKREVYLCGWDQ